jgi:hypothetical protein
MRHRLRWANLYRWVMMPMALLPFLGGCSALIVKSRESVQHSAQDSRQHGEPGVPFYVKTEIYRQHSAYDYRWIDVRLTIADVIGYDDKKKPVTKPPAVRVKHVSRTPGGLASVRAFQSMVADFQASGDEEQRMHALDAAWRGLDSVVVDPENPTPDSSAFTLVRNALERALVTDYKRVYYLNARSTWFSVGKVDAEIGADGSLAKANGESGGGLPELITAAAGILPISSLLSKKWNLTSTAPTLKGGAVTLQREVLATVEVEEHGYRYDFVREFTEPPCKEPPYPAVDGRCLEPIRVDLARGVFTRGEIGAESKSDKKPTIEVEGHITLPEADKGKDDKK